jgi:segregation and condensation protein B
VTPDAPVPGASPAEAAAGLEAPAEASGGDPSSGLRDVDEGPRARKGARKSKRGRKSTPAEDGPEDRGTQGGDGSDAAAATDGASPAGENVLPFVALAPGAAEAPSGDPAATSPRDPAPDEVDEVDEDEPRGEELPDERLQSVVASLLFASDRPLALPDLKRLLNMRDVARITAAIEEVSGRMSATGIQIVPVAGGWRLRTHPENGPWVSKLLVGKPVRLSRAMLETLSIIAYRQPITRPEVDEIRGVDCGPVIKTLLDRTLIRIIGKKEDVGRPLLYGTTPEFLRIFNLRDLTELPTLREFHELNAESQAKLEAKHGKQEKPAAPGGPDGPFGAGAPPPAGPVAPHAGVAGPDPDEDESLLEELEEATAAAARATGAAETDPNAPPTQSN